MMPVWVRVSWQSASESAGSLRPSQLVVCSRVSWQSMFESVQVGDPCPSQLAHTNTDQYILVCTGMY